MPARGRFAVPERDGDKQEKMRRTPAAATVWGQFPNLNHGGRLHAEEACPSREISRQTGLCGAILLSRMSFPYVS